MARTTAVKVFGALLQGFTPRQREILGGRFALEGGKGETLAALGERYGITRERIRQIEAGAIAALGGKVRANKECAAVLARSRKVLKNSGGVLKESDLLQANASLVDGLRPGHLQLVAEATREFHYHPLDDEYWPFYYSDREALTAAASFLSRFLKALRAKKENVLSGGFEAQLAVSAREEKVPLRVARTTFPISKRIRASAFGEVGLAEWPEIHPKTIRDRIYVVLKKHPKAVHFREIATLINQANLGGRKALAATVHNELIKDARFVLVGRGIYGLRERGYRVGTAKEVIHGILKEEGPLTLRELISAVQRDRIFKPNTILANLQDKRLFTRLEGGKYRVREA
jgi:hypothetical protein